MAGKQMSRGVYWCCGEIRDMPGRRIEGDMKGLISSASALLLPGQPVIGESEIMIKKRKE